MRRPRIARGGMVNIRHMACCAGACIVPMSVALAQTAPADGAAQELLRQQERQRMLRQQQEQQPEVHLPQPTQADQDRLPEKESPCFRIDRIVLTGDAADRFEWALAAADPSDETRPRGTAWALLASI